MPDRQMIAYLEHQAQEWQRTVDEFENYEKVDDAYSYHNAIGARDMAQAALVKAKELYKPEPEADTIQGFTGGHYVLLGGDRYAAVCDPIDPPDSPDTMATLQGPLAVEAHRRFMNAYNETGESRTTFDFDLDGESFHVETSAGPAGEVVLIVTGGSQGRSIVDTGICV